jgi:ferredoxin
MKITWRSALAVGPVSDCPLGAIRLKKKKAVIDDRCSQCGACMRVCPEEAISTGDISLLEGIQCDACPIECRIKDGNPGACQRYRNESGKLVRVTPVHPFSEVEGAVGPDPAEAIRRPLITASAQAQPTPTASVSGRPSVTAGLWSKSTRTSRSVKRERL